MTIAIAENLSSAPGTFETRVPQFYNRGERQKLSTKIFV
jgi:hypothetical protein